MGKNTKALFRRGVAHRKLNLFELARADLEKARSLLGKDKSDAAIARELKLLDKDEKGADKQFYANMKKQMQKAQRKKKKQKEQKEKAMIQKKAEREKADDNPNIKANVGDSEQDFVWDQPADKEQEAADVETSEAGKATEPKVSDNAEPSQF